MKKNQEEIQRLANCRIHDYGESEEFINFTKIYRTFYLSGSLIASPIFFIQPSIYYIDAG